MQELIKYLNGEKYSYNECYNFLINNGKEFFSSCPAELIQLIKNRYKNTRSDFISFVDSIFYERIIVNDNGILTQINDDDINIVKPIVFLPYKGIYTKSKDYNIMLDYLMYKNICKDEMFLSNDNSFLLLSKFMLQKTPLNKYSDNTIKNVNPENFFDDILKKINDFAHVKKIDVENFYKNYHVAGVNKESKASLIGKKGELLFYKKLKNYIDVLNDKYNLNIDLYFVSQDVNDSLNYDLLVYIPETGEAHVIEVKTTTILDQYNNIQLSSREYSKYLKGMNTRKGASFYKRFTSYNIIRLYIKDDHIERLTLLTKDNDYYKYIMDLIGSSKIYVDCYNNDVLIGSYTDTNKGYFSISRENNKLTNLDKSIFNKSILEVLFKNICSYSEMLELSKNQVIDNEIMKKILK